MIRILPNNHHFHLIERTQVEGIENQLTRRIADSLRILLPHSLSQLCKIRLLELCAKVRLPSLFYLYIHYKNYFGCEVTQFIPNIVTFSEK